MKMKRVIAGLTALLLLFAATGCGVQTLPAETEPADTTNPLYAPQPETREEPTQAVTELTELPGTAAPTRPPAPIVYPAPEEASLAMAASAIQLEKSSVQADEAILTFTGDCTLASFPECPTHLNFHSVYRASGSQTYPFDYVKQWFQNDDHTVINLENALTNATKAEKKEWRFKGPPEYAGMLAPAGIEAVTLENNHAKDYFAVGLSDTKKALTSNGVQYAADGNPYRFTAKGIHFVLLNFDCRTWRQERYGPDLISQYCAAVQREKKQNNIVIVAMHWGVEYRANPEGYQKDYARKMIDAGADLIVGHHPHQLQGIEQYKNKYIVYSLGNFAFGGNEKAVKAARDTMMVRPRFALRDGAAVCTGLAIVPCLESSAPDPAVNNYRPKPLFGAQARRIRDKVLALSKNLPDGIRTLECYS